MRYSAKCHAHFNVGKVTTIVTDGKAYYTIGVRPEENPAFNPILKEKYHLTHLKLKHGKFDMHKYKFVDIFVEHDQAIHAAFTNNPVKSSKPYQPHKDIMRDVKDFENFIIDENNNIFEEYHESKIVSS